MAPRKRWDRKTAIVAMRCERCGSIRLARANEAAASGCACRPMAPQGPGPAADPPEVPKPEEGGKKDGAA